jgi:hypothetical protein
MEQFPAYPVETSKQPTSPEDRFVVVATGLPKGQQGADTHCTDPLTSEQAHEVMAQISAGRPSAPLPGSIDLVAEIEPGRLVVRCYSGFFGGDETFDVRLARVLYCRDQLP